MPPDIVASFQVPHLCHWCRAWPPLTGVDGKGPELLPALFLCMSPVTHDSTLWLLPRAVFTCSCLVKPCKSIEISLAPNSSLSHDNGCSRQRQPEDVRNTFPPQPNRKTEQSALMNKWLKYFKSKSNSKRIGFRHVKYSHYCHNLGRILLAPNAQPETLFLFNWGDWED